MFAAMGKDPFLVAGSEHRDIDYERFWRNRLAKLSHKKLLRQGQ